MSYKRSTLLSLTGAKFSTDSSLHRVSKNCAKLFLSVLCQISTNFDNFWQKDGKEAVIMRDTLIFHLI